MIIIKMGSNFISCDGCGLSTIEWSTMNIISREIELFALSIPNIVILYSPSAVSVVSNEYVVLSTILAAVITPSTDPLTQIIMTTALLILYLGGAGFVILLKK